MKNEPPVSGAVTETIERRFDTILGRHMQRLLGTRNGIDGLPITINAISCIILLAEQAKNEKGGLVQSEPYTREMLRDELTDLCLDPDEVMETAIPAMIGRGYIQIHADSGISVKDHTVRMARILDRIFPTMPGINLVAYLAQAMDEVASERKSFETAEDHLDQTLTIHGVAFKKKPAATGKNKTSVPRERGETLKREIRESLAENRRPIRSKIIRSSDFDATRHKAATMKKPHAVSEASPSPPAEAIPRGILETSGPTALPDIQETRSNVTDTERDTAGILPEAQEGVHEAGDHTPVFPDVSPPFPEEPPVASSAGNGENTSLSEPKIHEGEPAHSSPVMTEEEHSGEDRKTGKHRLEPDDGTAHPITGEDFSSSERDDDLVEKRIAAFADDLAMQCPLCGKAKIKPQKTSTGKCYYVCSEQKCTFISWGKPYHLACPECGNPFLIESAGKDGAPILKCPRATCFHWQNHPSETTERDNPSEKPSLQASQEAPAAPSPRKKRVVRKKVVRRKKR